MELTRPHIPRCRASLPHRELLTDVAEVLKQSVQKEALNMSLAALYAVTLIAVPVAVILHWCYSKRWGYGPAGVVATLILIFLFGLMLGEWEDD